MHKLQWYWFFLFLCINCNLCRLCNLYYFLHIDCLAFLIVLTFYKQLLYKIVNFDNINFRHIEVSTGPSHFVFSIRFYSGVDRGTVGFSAPQRKWATLSIGQVSTFNYFHIILNTLKLVNGECIITCDFNINEIVGPSFGLPTLLVGFFSNMKVPSCNTALHLKM